MSDEWFFETKLRDRKRGRARAKNSSIPTRIVCVSQLPLYFVKAD
jgi:hypothetical protein